MTKGLNTLIEDVYEVLRHPHTPSEENVSTLVEELIKAVEDKLQSSNIWKHKLRLSNIGKPDRILYYELSEHVDIAEHGAEEIDPATKLKFLFGALWEPILIFLIREAGHEVTNEQQAITIGGLTGYKDCDVDGVAVDIKSAYTYSFQDKFEKGNLLEHDPFGYVAQLSAYVQGNYEGSYEDLDEVGAFIAVDKMSGALAIFTLDSLEMINVEERIEYLRGMLKSETMPERCYEPVVYGKSGNMKLPTNCGYCSFKEDCWKDANGGQGIRRYQYKRNIVSFVNVTREPNNAKEIQR